MVAPRHIVSEGMLPTIIDPPIHEISKVRSPLMLKNGMDDAPSTQEKYVVPSTLQCKVPSGVQVPLIIPSMLPSRQMVPSGTEPTEIYFVELVRRGTQSEYEARLSQRMESGVQVFLKGAGMEVPL